MVKTLLLAGLWILTMSAAFASISLEKKSAQGSIKEASAGYVRVVDWTTGKDLIIQIDPQTRYQGVRKPIDLQEGDRVDVSYREEDGGKKTAALIARPENT